MADKLTAEEEKAPAQAAARKAKQQQQQKVKKQQAQQEQQQQQAQVNTLQQPHLNVESSSAEELAGAIEAVRLTPSAEQHTSRQQQHQALTAAAALPDMRRTVATVPTEGNSAKDAEAQFLHDLFCCPLTKVSKLPAFATFNTGNRHWSYFETLLAGSLHIIMACHLALCAMQGHGLLVGDDGRPSDCC